MNSPSRSPIRIRSLSPTRQEENPGQHPREIESDILQPHARSSPQPRNVALCAVPPDLRRRRSQHRRLDRHLQCCVFVKRQRTSPARRLPSSGQVSLSGASFWGLSLDRSFAARRRPRPRPRRRISPSRWCISCYSGWCLQRC